jgi:hypothetical protein
MRCLRASVAEMRCTTRAPSKPGAFAASLQQGALAPDGVASLLMTPVSGHAPASYVAPSSL